MKTCTSCKQSFSYSNFSKRAASKDGLAFQCKTCCLNKLHAWRLKNPEYAKIKSKQFREQNPDYTIKQNKKWDLNNPHKRRALNVKRRVVRISQTPQWLTQEQNQEILDFYIVAKMFRLYTGQDYHVDHIIPLRGKTVSGLHVPWNLQILPAKENLAKSNK